MTNHARFFKVWCHRYAASIFGAGSSPVIRNGAFLCFDSEQRAQTECDRLNAQRNDMQVRYSVEPSHVEVAVPLQAPSRAQVQAPPFLMSAMAPSHGFGHQMQAFRAAGRDGQKMDANP
jgi:hypothetical protein